MAGGCLDENRTEDVCRAVPGLLDYPERVHGFLLYTEAAPWLVEWMFTGLVEGIGRVADLCREGDMTRLWLEAGSLAEGVHPGDSIALNGCCLTATEIVESRIRFDLLAETMRVTNLQAVRAGAQVNIERAMLAGGRYGGHFVTGHIDATAPIRRWEQVGGDYELRVGILPEQGAYLVQKGCIAVDGISLTVAEVAPDEFSVWIIPHTRVVTALNERRVGDLVNLEFDLLAKYTEKILAARGVGAGEAHSRGN